MAGIGYARIARAAVARAANWGGFMKTIMQVAAFAAVLAVGGLLRGYAGPTSAAEAIMLIALGGVSFAIIAVPLWAWWRWRANAAARRAKK